MNLRKLAQQRLSEWRHQLTALPQSTAHESWPGLRALILGMLAPFALVVFIYARYFAGGPAAIGLTRAHLRRDLVLGASIGIPMLGLAAAFKSWAVPRYRAHTPADHTLQTVFFMAINAPVEELFWRGMVQTFTIRQIERIAGPGAQANATGWALTTLGFGAFHTIGGNWPRRGVIGATVGGGIFGLVYLLQPRPRSILPSILVHGLAGTGFFNGGDAILQWLDQHPPRHTER